MLGNRNMSSLIEVNPSILEELNLAEAFQNEEINTQKMKDFFLHEKARYITRKVYEGFKNGKPKSFLLSGRPGFFKTHTGLYLLDYLIRPIDDPLMQEVILQDTEEFQHSQMKQEMGQFLVCIVPPLDSNEPMINSTMMTAIDTALMRIGIEAPQVHSADAIEYCVMTARYLKQQGWGGMIFVMDDMESLMMEIENKEGSEIVSTLVQYFEFMANFKEFPVFFLGIGSMFPMKYITRGLEEDAMKRMAEVFDEFVWMDFEPWGWIDFVTTTILHHSSMEAIEVLTTNQEFENLARSVYESGLFQDQGVDYIQHKLLPVCFPLHPFTLMFLPRLSQIVSHSEKNLVNFFRDISAGSFRHFLDTFGIFQASGKLSVFTPDYLFSYYEKAIKESPHLRNFTEAINKANLLSGNNPLARRVIRLIALMQLVDHEVIRPTKKNIISTLHLDDRELKRFETFLVDMIQKNGFKFDRQTTEITLPVMKTSVNLDDFIQMRLPRIQQKLDPVEKLNNDFTMPPVHAQKYNHNYYTDRKVMCRHVSFEELRNPEFPRSISESLGRGTEEYKGDVAILYLLTQDDDELMEARNIVSMEDWAEVSRVVVAVPIRPVNFFKIVHEIEALDRIREEDPLFADPKSDERELLEKRYDELKAELDEKLEFFRRPERLYWYYRSNLIPQIQEKSLSELADAMMEENFPFSPVIQNAAVSSFADDEEYIEIRKKTIEKLLCRRGSIFLPSHLEKLYDGLIYDALVETKIAKFVQEAGHFHEYIIVGPLTDGTPIAAVWNTLYARIMDSLDEGIRVIPINEVLVDLLQPPYGINPALMEVLLAAIFHHCPLGVEIFDHFRRMQETGEHASLRKVQFSYDAFWQMTHDPEDVILYFNENPPETLSSPDAMPDAAAATPTRPETVSPEAPETPEPQAVPQYSTEEIETATQGQAYQVEQPQTASDGPYSTVEMKTPGQRPGQKAGGYFDGAPSYQEMAGHETGGGSPFQIKQPSKSGQASVRQSPTQTPKASPPPAQASPKDISYTEGIVEIITGKKPSTLNEPRWDLAKQMVDKWFQSLPPITRRAHLAKGDEVIGFLKLMRSDAANAEPVEFMTSYLPKALGQQYPGDAERILTIMKNIKSFLGRYHQIKAGTLWKAIGSMFTAKNKDFKGSFKNWLDRIPETMNIDRLSPEAQDLVSINPQANLKNVFLIHYPQKLGIGRFDMWTYDRNMEYLSKLSKAKLEVEVNFIISAFELPQKKEPKMEVAKQVFDKTFDGFQMPMGKRAEFVQIMMQHLSK